MPVVEKISYRYGDEDFEIVISQDNGRITINVFKGNSLYLPFSYSIDEETNKDFGNYCGEPITHLVKVARDDLKRHVEKMILKRLKLSESADMADILIEKYQLFTQKYQKKPEKLQLTSTDANAVAILPPQKLTLLGFEPNDIIVNGLKNFEKIFGYIPLEKNASTTKFV